MITTKLLEILRDILDIGTYIIKWANLNLLETIKSIVQTVGLALIKIFEIAIEAIKWAISKV